MKVKVIKANIDLCLLPGAKIFRDSSQKEWVIIPSVDEKEWQQNKASVASGAPEPNRNPSKIWAGVNANTKMPKRIVSVDIVPYAGDKDEWGHTHIVKFYKGLKGVEPKENNIILGNCKENVVEWKNFDKPQYNAENNSAPKQQPQAPQPHLPKQEQKQVDNSQGEVDLPF